MIITQEEAFLRLVVVTCLTALIGMEREYRNKPAGLRTNVMVGIGATLMTIASIKVLDLFPNVVGMDPMRVAAQIITGIGFIGAGAILRTEEKTNVVGLTTAATLWVVSGLGIAVGMGLYFEAIMATGFVFFTFSVISKGVQLIRKYSNEHPPQELLEEKLPHTAHREH